MSNISDVTTIFLYTYFGMEDMKLMYFCIFFFLYVTIIIENAVLMKVICVEKSLHEPMFILVWNLAANGLYGSTALFPAMLTNILSHTHEMSLSSCKTQLFALHTYAFIESTILAVMSYDRYLAICYPLQYHTIMSSGRLYQLIAFSWLYPFIAFLMFFILTLQLRFCKTNLEALYCINYAVVKLSCSDIFVYNILGLFFLFLYGIPQLTMIFYSYVHIFRICATLSQESKLKAFRTCIPHLLVVINYYAGGYLEVIQTRFNMEKLPFSIRVFMSVYYMLCPFMLNPAIYGISIRAVREPLLRPLVMLFRKKSHIKV